MTKVIKPQNIHRRKLKYKLENTTGVLQQGTRKTMLSSFLQMNDRNRMINEKGKFIQEKTHNNHKQLTDHRAIESYSEQTSSYKQSMLTKHREFDFYQAKCKSNKVMQSSKPLGTIPGSCDEVLRFF